MSGVVSVRQKYKLLKKIDVGGMAEIYRANLVSMKGFEKEVAIKKVLPNLTRNRRFVSMFLDEARLCMNLTHPNIVPVFDVGRSGDAYFIVMEFVNGTNLKRLFRKFSERGQSMPLHLAAFTVAEILKGLAYAHESTDASGDPLNIVHRDVSPPNILISQNGYVKLTDFGLAKASTQLLATDPGMVKGKFSYLAPETVSGNAPDHRTDIFSAGIILWELLSGRRLFVGRTHVETVEAVRNCNVVPISQLNSEIDPEFEEILNKALHMSPEERYQSAREFGDAITSYLFSHGLKVTNFDMAEFLTSLGETTPIEIDDEQIATLIEDELLTLSVMGLYIPGDEMEGTSPLHPDVLDLKDGVFELDDIFDDIPPETPDETNAEGQQNPLGAAPTGDATATASENTASNADDDFDDSDDELVWISPGLVALLAMAGSAAVAAIAYLVLNLG
ncbi:MAG: hypothetical protein CMH54_01125 [Myxococcales bacterium]|nr:hypothetical protein [Myxococcales bacterium]